MLKVESEENDASRCDSTHYENISLLCVIRKKKILSKLSFVCLKKTEELFAFFPHAAEKERRICCFCCVSVVKRLKVHFFLISLSVCQNVEKTTKNERNSS